jgi:hypothetical protein
MSQSNSNRLGDVSDGWDFDVDMPMEDLADAEAPDEAGHWSDGFTALNLPDVSAADRERGGLARRPVADPLHNTFQIEVLVGSHHVFVCPPAADLRTSPMPSLTVEWLKSQVSAQYQTLSGRSATVKHFLFDGQVLNPTARIESFFAKFSGTRVGMTTALVAVVTHESVSTFQVYETLCQADSKTKNVSLSHFALPVLKRALELVDNGVFNVCLTPAHVKIPAYSELNSMGLSAFFRSLAEDHGLTTLDLSDNLVRDADFNVLSETIHNCYPTGDNHNNNARAFTPFSALRTLSLRGTMLSDIGASRLFSALAKLPKLDTLDLSLTLLTDVCVPHLHRFLAHTKLQLRTLKLAGCHFTGARVKCKEQQQGQVTKDVEYSLAKALAHCELLETLNLSENPLSLYGLGSVLEALHQSPMQNTLRKLNLDLVDCMLEPVGSTPPTRDELALREFLLESLEILLRGKTCQVQELELSYWHAPDTKNNGLTLSKVVNTALRTKQSRLRKLTLAHCGLEASDLTRIFQALGRNTDLAELDVSFNGDLQWSSVRALRVSMQGQDRASRQLQLTALACFQDEDVYNHVAVLPSLTILTHYPEDGN